MNLLSSTIIYFIEMLAAYIFFTRVTDQRYSSIKTLLLGTVIFEVGAVLNIVFEGIVWLNMLIFFIINIVFFAACFYIKAVKAAFYAVVLGIISVVLEFLTLFLMSIIFDVNVYGYKSSTSLLIFEAAVCKSLYFFVCVMLSRFIKKNEDTGKISLSFYIFPAIEILSLIIFWYTFTKRNASPEIQTLIAIISMLMLLATVVLFVTYKHNLEKESQYILLKSEINRLQSEKVHYEILEHQNSRLMIYAHDAKKHLTAIRDINTNPLIEEYLNKMTDSLSEYTKVCQSGNIILDAIVNRYKTQCQLKKIDFTFNVRVCNLSFIDDFDLVTILGNLMDNAVEAAEKSEKKEINFETLIRNNYAVAVITNSSETAPVMKNNKFVTTKKDKSIHGLGLKSVSSALKKYGGDVLYDYDGNKKEFTVTISFKIPKNNIKSKEGA